MCRQSQTRLRLANSRRIAKYDGRYNLAECKDFVGSPAERQKSRFRAENIAILLHETVSDKFHALRCKGFLKNDSAGVLHYLYELPQLDVLARGQFAPECHNVYLWISKHIMIPEIGLRLLWCTSIAETLLQLHTAGWRSLTVTLMIYLS